MIPAEEYKLTKTQQKFADLIESTTNNYFLNGPPGTGKSVVTRYLNRNAGPKTWIVCAPTGLAALNANGKTLHKTFRLPISDGIIHPTYNNFPIDQRVINFIRYQIKHLLIDEISMVRADTFDFIDRMLRDIKRKDLPFGGIQVVVVGDFFQLPPVVKDKEVKDLAAAGWESPFAFSSKVWSTFETLNLTEVLRQKGDRKFIDFLHAARMGDVSPKQMVDLNSRVDPDPNDLRIQLFAWNSQVNALNRVKLKELSGEPIELEADSFGDWPEFPTDPLLELKIGAQVMVKLNGCDRPPDAQGDWESDVVNGTLGVVVEINGPKPVPVQDEDESDEAFELRVQGNIDWNTKSKERWNVIIETEHGPRTIYRKRWEYKVKEETAPGRWEEIVKASFEQIPLTLAWAVTMHKSQGQTFDKVHIDASKVFQTGQLYVALSRSRTMDGITLQDRINREKFKTSEAVIKYFERTALMVPMKVKVSNIRPSPKNKKKVKR